MASKKKGRGYLTWTDVMDKALLDTFVEFYNKGDRAQNGWKPHVYTAAVNNVREKCEAQVCKENIISRSKTFDKYYAIISNMLSQSGFGWDWDNNKVSVDSEEVWKTYVEANKDAASYRHKVIKNWDMISLIYSRDRATGTLARTAAESASDMAVEAANNSKATDATSSTQTEDEPKKRYRSDDSIANMLGEKLDNFTAAFKADAPEPPPSPEVLATINQIPGLGEDDTLPDGLKKRWVLKQIYT